MEKDKLSDILGKHLVADVQMKNEYFDENDPHIYTERRTHLTATGAIFLQRGMRFEALSCFHRACVERRDDFWARFYLGSMALEVNKPESANYYLRACLEEAPKDWVVKPLLLTNYSSVQFKLGDFKGAESSLEEAIKTNPSLDAPYYMKAIHKIYRRQYNDAYELVKRGLRKVPKSKLLKHLELDIQEIIENP